MATGGGIFNAGAGDAVVSQSAIEDNRTGAGHFAGTHGQAGAGGVGGGIFNGGEMLLRSSTVDGNATGEGGIASVCVGRRRRRHR